MSEKNEIALRSDTELRVASGKKLLLNMSTDAIGLAITIRDEEDNDAAEKYEQAKKIIREGDVEAGIKILIPVASLGFLLAQLLLAKLFLTKSSSHYSAEDAFYWYSRAADQRSVEAQLKLAWLYEAGEGVERDQKKSVHWYRMAAEQGNLEAQFNLGAKYDNGEGVTQNYEEAVRWYRMSAEQGYADARFYLAQALEHGTGVVKDIEEATDWYYLAAEQDHPSSLRKLWRLVLDESFIPEDEEEELFIEKIGISQNHALSQFKYAYRYNCGIGVKQDFERAKSFYKKAAENGIPEANDFLALNYRYGSFVGGVNFNMANVLSTDDRADKSLRSPAWMYFERPLKADVPDKVRLRANAQDKRKKLLIAILNEEEDIFTAVKDYYFDGYYPYEISLPLLEIGLDRGCTDPHAFVVMSYIYWNADLPLRDRAKACEMASLACDLGSQVGCGNAWVFNRLSGEVDKARDALVKGANLRDPGCMFDLGYAYEGKVDSDLGVKLFDRDKDKACYWYSKVTKDKYAKEGTKAIAFYNLGISEEDVDLAYFYFEQAAELNYRNAICVMRTITAQKPYEDKFEWVLNHFDQSYKDTDKGQKWLSKLKSIDKKAGASDVLSHEKEISRRDRLNQKRALTKKSLRTAAD